MRVIFWPYFDESKSKGAISAEQNREVPTSEGASIPNTIYMGF